MRKGPSTARFCLTSIVLVCAFVLLQTMSHGEAIVLRQPLHDLPYTMGRWNGQDQPLEPQVVQAVGVTDYVNRFYSRPSNEPVQLYVGYYGSQRTGDTIHSPKNCLPGAGWDPIRSAYATIQLSGGRSIIVNEYVVQRDQNKQLVFYWYQGRGRVIASEYKAKVWMIADAIERNRTDAALVRLVTPMDGGETRARVRLVTFTKTLFPSLDRLIPK
ncbi:MAG: exosortase C-terminal domain/associated protein EpsI [Candidatus Acidiferrales bacterium]